MKPTVICHMMTSVDGRLYVGRFTPLAGGKSSTEASSPYYEISANFGADAQVIGGRTAREVALPRRFQCDVATPVENFSSFIGNRQSKRSLIVLDRAGTIHYETDTVHGENLITVLGEGVSQQYLDHLRERGVSYLFAGRDGTDIPKLLSTLGSDFGMAKVLVSSVCCCIPVWTGWPEFRRSSITTASPTRSLPKASPWS